MANPISKTELINASTDANSLSVVTNGDDVTNVTSRLGRVYPTIAKLFKGFRDSAAVVLTQIGYAVPVTYASAIVLTSPNQTVSYNGVVYAPISNQLPFTTSGTFETAKFRIIQGVAAIDLAKPGAAALVGFLPTGVGAAATTVQAALDIFNQKPSGFFYQEQGAKVQRVADRLFVGDAIKNNGTNAGSQPDWLTQLLLARGRTFAFQQVSQQAVLTVESPASANAFLAAGKTSQFADVGNTIGILGVGVNDNTAHSTGAYGGYFEGFQMPDTLGPAYGVEIDAINFRADAVTDPYSQHPQQVIGLQIASSAEFTGSVFPASAALNIRNNGQPFSQGIVFGFDSIVGATGTTGTGIAISFGKGHQMMWYSSAGQATASIVGNGSTPSLSVSQSFLDNAVNFTSNVGKIVGQIAQYPNAVNYPSLRGNIAGSAVQLQALGDDTNIDIQLVTKGSGAVWLAPWASNVDAPINGYMTVKDLGGVVRKLATIS